MRSWTICGVGRPRDALQFRSNAPSPTPPMAGKVLIKVSHVSLNRGDVRLLEKWIPFRMNGVPGMDFTGEIVQMGAFPVALSSKLHIGMTVSGTVPLMDILSGVGSLAEYIIVPAYALTEKPQSLDGASAAGLLGVAGQTSAVVLRAAGLRQGDKVLINGASGGVGTILVQVLCGMGMRVVGICSARNEALVRRLGAEEIIDYNAHEDIYGHLSSVCSSPGGRPFDSIIDCVGDVALCSHSEEYLKPDGKCVSIEGSFLQQLKANWLPKMLGGMPRTYQSIMTYPSGMLAQEAGSWFSKGLIKGISIDSTYKMEDALLAFEKQATGRVSGKVLIEL